MIKELGWDSPGERRVKSRLILLYKVTHQLVAIPSDYLIPAYTATRASHSLKIKQIYVGAQYYQQSFFPRTIREWNRLPTSVADAPNLLAFKQALSEVPASGYLA